MDASQLAKIPGELRNQIYLAYVEQTDVIHVAIDGERPYVQPHILALMRTCRQVYQESLEVFRKTSPTATIRLNTAAVEGPCSASETTVLANAALVLFSSSSQACAYTIEAVEIHLGEVDVADQARFHSDESAALLHEGWECNTTRKLTTLVSSALPATVPCRLTCTFIYDSANLPPVSLQLAEYLGSVYRIFCHQRRLEDELKGDVERIQAVSKACARLSGQFYPTVPPTMSRLSQEDVRCYREAVRQRRSYMAAEVEKRRVEIAKRVARERDMHCWAMV